jgi:acyl-CoA thioesterase
MHPFDQAIQLHSTGPDTYQGETTPDYANMVGPFGGVTCAVMLQAVLQHPKRLGQPIALTVNFASGVADGQFTVQARPVRTNRSTQHWIVEALQNGEVVTSATVVMAVRRETWGVSEAQAPRDLPDPQTLVRLPQGNRLPWAHHYDLRWVHPQNFGGFDGKEHHDSSSVQWLRDDPPRLLDFAALASLCDCFFPRILLRRHQPVPLGSVTITTYFHADDNALAAQGDRYLIGAARGQHFQAGFFDQSGQIWSHDGHLLASSHQMVYFKA